MRDFRVILVRNVRSIVIAALLMSLPLVIFADNAAAVEYKVVYLPGAATIAKLQVSSAFAERL